MSPAKNNIKISSSLKSILTFIFPEREGDKLLEDK